MRNSISQSLSYTFEWNMSYPIREKHTDWRPSGKSIVAGVYIWWAPSYATANLFGKNCLCSITTFQNTALFSSLNFIVATLSDTMKHKGDCESSILIAHVFLSESDSSCLITYYSLLTAKYRSVETSWNKQKYILSFNLFDHSIVQASA